MHREGKDRISNRQLFFTMSENPANTSPKPGRSPAAVFLSLPELSPAPVWPLEAGNRCDLDSNKGDSFWKVRIDRRSQAAVERPVNSTADYGEIYLLGNGPD